MDITMMKAKPLFFLILAISFFLFLVACQSAATPQEEGNLVYIVENDYVRILNNGELVSPGKSVRFTLRTAEGYSITATDYSGDYRIWQSGNQTYIELQDVNYPTRIELTLSSKYRTVTYDPNGGVVSGNSSSTVDITYDLSIHSRPNTSNGVGLFSRSGYTLESWNTAADGSGERIGLGSRVTVEMGGLTLYAQWAKWTDASEFTYIQDENGITITGYKGSASSLVIPQTIEGLPVVAIASDAFKALSGTDKVVLSPTLQTVEDNAFTACNFTQLVLYDNLETFSDASFNSQALTTLYINAVEAPYGYVYRRESMYADKVDLLINAQGQKKMVWYAGCSTWYNLDSDSVKAAFGQDYTIINMGLNGTVNSWVQMEILSKYIEDGDLFIHSPEISSKTQMMDVIDMTSQDYLLWCGLENNYDLFTLVDSGRISGIFDSLCLYLGKKKKETTYDFQRYTNDGNPYIDDIGCVPFVRDQTSESLSDKVKLEVEPLLSRSYDSLQYWYNILAEKGARIYISCAVVNLDAVPEDQQGNVAAVATAFDKAMSALDNVTVISKLGDFIYRNEDFYDTNYHLLSKQVVKNTAVWIRDIKNQLEKDANN